MKPINFLEIITELVHKLKYYQYMDIFISRFVQLLFLFRLDFKDLRPLRRNPMAIYQAEVDYKLANHEKNKKKGKVDLSLLQDYLCLYIDGSDMIILWLDNDIAGEDISFQIKIMLETYLFEDEDNRPVDYKPENMMRARFSSLSKREILNSFQNSYYHLDENKSLAFSARNEIDLRLGVAFTTLLSNELGSLFPSNREAQRTISYGPCQFPTFWF